MTQVLDHGSVELLDSMASDLKVVGAARVSTGKDPEHSSKGEDADAKLIGFLMSNGHGTPFEHAVFQFYVKAPIFVAREWFRHRIGSFNEQSGRYGTYKPEFYIPDHVRVPHPDNKQMSVRASRKDAIPADLWDDLLVYIRNKSTSAFDAYTALLNYGVAREMARMVLPVNLYTSFWWTVNARSLMNFLMLRADERAQWEIKMYAEVIEDVLRGAMPLTYSAWIAAERKAP